MPRALPTGSRKRTRGVIKEESKPTMRLRQTHVGIRMRSWEKPHQGQYPAGLTHGAREAH